jgi:hypothetical protein
MNVKSDIEKAFERDPFAFMSKYGVYPQDFNSQTKPPPVFDKSVKDIGLDEKLTIKKRAMMIAYARLKEVAFGVGTKKNSYDVTFYAQDDVKGHEDKCVPLWFLPWASNAITSMTIPPKLPTKRPDGSNTGILDPDFFFTAAINGCSVFVHGDPKAPTISHAGTADPRSKTAATVSPIFDSAGKDTGQKLYTPSPGFFTSGNAKSHWKGVHERHFGANTNASSIDTTDYKNYLGTDNTREAVEYERFLNDKSGKELRIDMVQSSGCVFGMRDAQGSWSFYLQKNVEIGVTKLQKKFKFFKPNEHAPKLVPSGRIRTLNDGTTTVEMIEKKIQISIPIHVMKFFPGKDASGATAMLEKNKVRALIQAALK